MARRIVVTDFRFRDFLGNWKTEFDRLEDVAVVVYWKNEGDLRGQSRLIALLNASELSPRFVTPILDAGASTNTLRGLTDWGLPSMLPGSYSLCLSTQDKETPRICKSFRIGAIPPPLKGTLRVGFSPTPADVIVSGTRHASVPTPWVEDRDPGLVIVRIEKTGFVPQQKPVMVEAGKAVILNFTLEPTPPPPGPPGFNEEILKFSVNPALWAITGVVSVLEDLFVEGVNNILERFVDFPSELDAIGGPGMLALLLVPLPVGKASRVKALASPKSARVLANVARTTATEQGLMRVRDIRKIPIEEVIRNNSKLLQTASEKGASPAVIEEAIRIQNTAAAKQLIAASSGPLRTLLQKFADNPAWGIAGLIGGITAALGFQTALSYAQKEIYEKPGLAVWSAIDVQNWKLANEANKLYQQFIIITKETFLSKINELLPVFGTPFVIDLKGAQTQHDAWQQQIDDQLEKKTLLRVSTNVDPATFEIAGIPQAFPSPSEIELEAGEYDVTAIKTGFKPKTEHINVFANQTTTLAFKLDREPGIPPPGKGNAVVSTLDATTLAPILSTIRLDGEIVGTGKPVHEFTASAGEHELRTEAVGYITQTAAITIREGRTTEFEYRLEKTPKPPPEPEMGFIEVVANIPATISISGFPEQTTPAKFTVPPGTYDVAGTPRDNPELYRTVFPQRVYVASGKTVFVSFAFQLREITPPGPPPEEYGILEARSTPSARVYIGEEMLSDSTPFEAEILTGIYDVIFRQDGFIEERRTALIKKDLRTILDVTLRAELEPPEQEKAWRLDLESVPTGAKILVNLQFTGKWAPDYLFLVPGEYLVSLEKSGYKRWSRAITLEEF